MRPLLLLLIFTFIYQYTNCQDLSVESFYRNDTDISARIEKRVDVNGNMCALIKVYSAVPCDFEGNIIGDVQKRNGVYWVYLCARNPQSSKLLIYAQIFRPLIVDFDVYNINIDCGETYSLIIETPSNKTFQDYPISANEKEINIYTSELGNYIISINNVEFTMVYVEGGNYIMGCKESKEGLPTDDNIAHEVTLNDYFIGETEVTQALWEAVMGNNPSIEVDVSGYMPVNNVSYYDARRFIDSLNLITGLSFRLPSEAEWEYAARGGKNSKGYRFSGSDNINEITNGMEISRVALTLGNELGLFDMTGNVWEWSEDDSCHQKENGRLISQDLEGGDTFRDNLLGLGLAL